MEKGLLDLHSVMRWLIILFAVLALVTGIGGMNGKKTFSKGNKRIALFLMISCDIQLLVGIILYFISPMGLKNIQNVGMANVMKNNVSRFFAIEHTVAMLIAIILIHIGYSAVKKNIPDGAKFKRLFWYTFIALLIILFSIPWPWRAGMAGYPLLPGMSA